MRILGAAVATAAVAFGATVTATGASAQPAHRQSAEAFARSFYQEGSTGNWRRLLTADTARLQRAAEARSQGEVPEFLDADPVCTCQDDVAIRVLSVRTTPVRGGLTQASVRFEFIADRPTPARTVRFLLARSGRGWRIQDIVYPFGRRTVSYRWALQHTGAR